MILLPDDAGCAGLFYALLSSPIGALHAIFSHKGLLLLDFKEDERERDGLYQWRKRNPQALLNEGDDQRFAILQNSLDAYFSGSLQQFRLPLDLRGTPFQLMVWQSLLRIAYGETYSYTQQAAALGRAKAVRAVAVANARNPLSIVVPCHRVIGKDGSLTGYAGGLARKRFLLQLEKDGKIKANG